MRVIWGSIKPVIKRGRKLYLAYDRKYCVGVFGSYRAAWRALAGSSSVTCRNGG